MSHNQTQPVEQTEIEVEKYSDSESINYKEHPMMPPPTNLAINVIDANWNADADAVFYNPNSARITPGHAQQVTDDRSDTNQIFIGEEKSYGKQLYNLKEANKWSASKVVIAQQGINAAVQDVMGKIDQIEAAADK